MNNLSVRPVIYLVGVASIFVIMFGIRASAYILNPILLAAVITITVLPIPSRLTKRGLPGWLSLVLSILVVVFALGLVILTVFFSISRLSTESAAIHSLAPRSRLLWIFLRRQNLRLLPSQQKHPPQLTGSLRA